MFKFVKVLDSKFIAWCAKEGLDTNRKYAYTAAIIGSLIGLSSVVFSFIKVIDFFKYVINLIL